MKGQICMDLSSVPKQKKNDNYLRQKWRNGIQKYCNEMALKEGDYTAMCVCGNMNYCYKCLDSGDKMACAKAICSYIKEKKIKVDFTDNDYSKFIEKLEERK